MTFMSGDSSPALEAATAATHQETGSGELCFVAGSIAGAPAQRVQGGARPRVDFAVSMLCKLGVMTF